MRLSGDLQQQISVPNSARSYPPSPGVKAIEEVEHKRYFFAECQADEERACNFKHMPTSRPLFVEDYLE